MIFPDYVTTTSMSSCKIPKGKRLKVQFNLPQPGKSMRIGRQVLLIALAFSLVLLGFQAPNGVLGSGPIRSNAQSATTGCTPQDTFRLTSVGLPSSVNINTLSGEGTQPTLIFWEYYNLSPLPFPNGTLDWATSVSDSYTTNSNYTQWTFHIRPGLVWSNGQNVTSNDVVASFGPNMYFNSTYDYLGLESEVTSVDPVNASTVVFNLNASDAQLPTRLSQVVGDVVWPASVINSLGSSAAGYTNLGTNIADGPFYVSNYTSGSTQLVMLRNPYFKPQPQICQIDVTLSETLSLTATTLLGGSSDLAPVEYSDVPAVLKNPNLRLFDEKGYQINEIQYNDSLYPYNMTAFRQALAYGINDSEVVQQGFDGYATPAFSSEGIVPPEASLVYNPHIMNYSFNQKQALSLLQTIGISQASDGSLHYSNGTRVSLTIWSDTDNSEDALVARVVQSNLQNMGFSVSIQTTSVSNIIAYESANVQNIRNAMILYTSPIGFWGSAYVDIEPGWDIYWPATTPDPYWEYPPSANTEYLGNVSAFDSTSNTTLGQEYASNVQALNAQYLPTLVLAWPDYLWGYNVQHWTNWPGQNGLISLESEVMQPSSWENLVPVSSTNTSSPTSTNATTTSTYPTITSSSTTSSSTSSTVSTTSTSSSQSSSNLTLEIAAVVIVVIILAAATAVFLRRRR
jgi:ABC-type transport system substrate-binding protein